MSAPRDLNRHFWLMHGIARALGANFTAAMSEGRLRADDYAELVARCCGCAATAACVTWLGEHGAGALAPPSFCRVGAELSGLAATRARPVAHPAPRRKNPV